MVLVDWSLRSWNESSDRFDIVIYVNGLIVGKSTNLSLEIICSCIGQLKEA